MNWGKSIILAFVLFAGFIGMMVFRMTQNHVDLVSDNYYQHEIDFQQQIDRVNNTQRLDSADRILYQPDQQQMRFTLPDSLKTGTIRFYRPGDRKQDFQVDLTAQHPAQQVVSTRRLGKGNWRIQFTWSDGQRDYYQEKLVYF